MNRRGFILCADDFALHPLVDEAVLRLAQAGRLSATSCMSTAPRWRAAAPLLLPLRPRLQVGLHFNLTEGHGGAHGARPLGRLLAAAYARRLSAARLRAAWRAQLDAFEDAMGAAPDFIDGHQHVHQLPGVRQALLAELQARYAGRAMPWVRSTVPAGALWRDPKAAVIALLGGWSCTRQLARAGVAMNRGFGGVYGFDASSAEAYGAHMQAWLGQVGGGSLLMCHPAAGEVPGDAIGRQRPVEFAYLMSDAFARDLERQGCCLLLK
ncbi:ChbG/HpnK family deacetylase [Alicycliphilus denitrificans]|uniref:ChbG/HpnK family deacetylase n=1 Tax=Alicycliphilus denitrificans TaxID=179636 RepID=UPI00384BB65C